MFFLLALPNIAVSYQLLKMIVLHSITEFDVVCYPHQGYMALCTVVTTGVMQHIFCKHWNNKRDLYEEQQRATTPKLGYKLLGKLQDCEGQ